MELPGYRHTTTAVAPVLVSRQLILVSHLLQSDWYMIYPPTEKSVDRRILERLLALIRISSGTAQLTYDELVNMLIANMFTQDPTIYVLLLREEGQLRWLTDERSANVKQGQIAVLSSETIQLKPQQELWPEFLTRQAIILQQRKKIPAEPTVDDLFTRLSSTNLELKKVKESNEWLKRNQERAGMAPSTRGEDLQAQVQRNTTAMFPTSSSSSSSDHDQLELIQQALARLKSEI